jgi:ribosomal protein S18 acetylase RimI-like enzyme
VSSSNDDARAHPGGPRLDRPIWHALTGPHTAFAEQAHGADGTVLAARYQPEVAPFGAVGRIDDPAAWDALGSVVEPGGTVVIMLRSDAPDSIRPWPPTGWVVTADIPGHQMVARTMAPEIDDDAVTLDRNSVPEMLDLVSRARPGPFEKRTIELGGYVGLRHHGRLVAMAGRRFAAGGFTEISAVCTDADHRGRGLGGRLLRTVAAGIIGDGNIPFLHVAAGNAGAIALYEKLGMARCRAVRFIVLRRPAPE